MTDSHDIKAQAPDSASPPSAIRVRCLGRFELTVAGERVTGSGRTHGKPICLLKAMLARGGADVNAGALAAHLWPDLDGDAARNALAVALHRLRKMLGSRDAILTAAGQLSINGTLVWVDAREFEVLSEQLPKIARAGQASADHVEQLLECYRGAFLTDDICSWALAMRDRLRSRFLRTIGLLADALARQRSGGEVITLCRHAIETEPTAEEFHVRLIQCYCTEGRHAEALDAYQRCRQLLLGILGVEPAPATRALVSSRRAGEPGHFSGSLPSYRNASPMTAA